MKRTKIFFSTVLAAFLLAQTARATEYITPQPLVEVLKNTPVRDCSRTDKWKMNIITWGADMVTIFGNGDSKTTTRGSAFGKAGLNIELIREDDLAKQVKSFLACETQFLRGTVAMMVIAADFGNKDPRLKLIPVVQKSWSKGADAAVYKKGITSAEDVDVWAAQAYGPHMDWAIRTLLDSGKKPSSKNIKWTQGLVGLSGSTPGAAFRENETVDGAFVISPDSTALTAGSGSGAEDSVPGARVGFTTYTADHVIADVIMVRADFYEQHKQEIDTFRNVYYRSVEELGQFMKDRKSASYKTEIKKMAMLLLDSDGDGSVADTEGMYDGANIVGWKGNVNFFADPNNPRSFKNVWDSASQALLSLNFIEQISPVPAVDFDFEALKTGLSDTSGVQIPKFDAQRARNIVANRERMGTLDKGGVFRPFSVGFGINQTTFSPGEYAADFDRAIQAVTTYGGALVTIEGHVDPYKYLKRKKDGATERELREIMQSGKNTSRSRADALRDALIAYAQNVRHVSLNKDNIETVGHGFAHPTTSMCGTEPCMPKTRAEQLSNMRAEIRINVIEAEELLPE